MWGKGAYLWCVLCTMMAIEVQVVDFSFLVCSQFSSYNEDSPVSSAALLQLNQT